ncbi:MAG TPA: hypothetical protein VFY87_27600 [Geminicoccaceae bacterium]|nr:hypothetical protein [Geminicoccaceae bacterium]
MFLAADPLPRDTMDLLAAATAGRRRRNPYARRDWIRVSQRLATGLTPKQVARAEGTDEAAIGNLLAQDGFRELVAAHEEFLAEPPEAAMARLVRLARLALENALSADWDVGAALFVLREHKRGRDAAETVAKGVIAASRRALRAAASRRRPRPRRRRRRASELRSRVGV